ncbi:helix-turn-helix transcriptional regulator [Nocardioides coralli]|nr:helix-turn-helix transcriptional regulator [Nocardioides coralli]
MVAAAHHAEAAVLLAAGDRAGARRAAEDAVSHYERAGAAFGAGQAQALLQRATGETDVPASERLITPREADVLRLVAEGLSNAAIAERLHLSEHTVHRHVANVLTKLDVATRAAAVAKAAGHGLL